VGSWNYWLALAKKVSNPVTLEAPLEISALPGDIFRTVDFEFDSRETEVLVQSAQSAYGADVSDILLAGLALTLQAQTDTGGLLIDLEGHGREAIVDGVDLSRTVGWFTSLYPIYLEFAERRDLANIILSTKEHLRNIPHRGLSFGILRYLTDDQGLYGQLEPILRAEIVYNYLGRINQEPSPFFDVVTTPKATGQARSDRNLTAYKLQISALILDGSLRMHWSYDTSRLSTVTVEKLVYEYENTLHLLLDHCQTVNTVGYTPSDFSDVDLSQEDLDALLSEIDDLIDIGE
jgi:non-ribosomal peptide synthase protein (TIGR01720 family)